jgi:hypothetical protein
MRSSTGWQRCILSGNVALGNHALFVIDPDWGSVADQPDGKVHIPISGLPKDCGYGRQQRVLGSLPLSRASHSAAFRYNVIAQVSGTD